MLGATVLREFRRPMVWLALCGALTAWFPVCTVAQVCRGDCNGDGAVSVDEIILGVNIGLEVADVSVCPAMDNNHDLQVTVDELISAVTNALNDCPTSTPPPTFTPTRTVTVSAVPTPTTGTGNLPPRAVDDAAATLVREPVSIFVLANDSAPNADPLHVTNFTQPANGSVHFTKNVATYTPNGGFSGTNSFTYTISDGDGGTASATVTVVVNLLPPDPATVAPPPTNGVATIVADATRFLYTGASAVQFGVAPGTIAPIRAAVLRGKVTTRAGSPLPGVRITILNHPEFGFTASRADGMFDMAVNGGGLLTVNYEKSGLCPVQRQVTVPWQDYAMAPDVVMTALDPMVTSVALGTSSPMQMHQGSMQTDADGARHAMLLFMPGTSAGLVMADGTMQPVSSLHIRATEFTVGTNGPPAMPAVLPPTSGYTYAVELSADEAMAQGATDVQFDRPVFSYLENFIGFPVGTIVPVGFYDRQRAAWVPSQNGRVIKILGMTGGSADVDTDGDGNADTGEGITDGERQQLATLYAAGQTLWRVPVTHFTPWDYNWPFGPPDDATAPDGEVDSDQPLDGSCETPANSVIECENQVLGESVAIVGTPYTLNYRSDRVPGRAANRLNIKLGGASVPASLASIKLNILVAGRTFNQSFPAAANQQTTFVWDGEDAYGRPMQGQQGVAASIEYVYPLVYKTSSAALQQSFAQFGSTPFTANRSLATVVASKQFIAALGGVDARTLGMGGWTLSVHHFYDALGRVLHTGDGRRRRAESLASIIETVVGPRTIGDTLESLAIASDGSFYFGVFLGSLTRGSVVKKLSPDGKLATVAGGGGQLLGVSSLSVGPDGTLYIADELHRRVVRLTAAGGLAPVAGTGVAGFSGDGGPATEAQLLDPVGIAAGPDGSLYIADNGNQRIRRVGPDGIITTVAGTGVGGFGGDEGLGTLAMLNAPLAVSLGPDGSLYIADYLNNRIRRLGTDGIITTVVGTGVAGFSGDGGLAAAAAIQGPSGLIVTRDGTLYIDDEQPNHRIRVVTPNGIIRTFAGTGSGAFNGDGLPALQTNVGAPRSFVEAPDGTLYFADIGTGEIRRVTKPLPGFSVSDIAIPSEDGSLLYQFDSVGRHLRTLHTLTGATLFEFGYDSDGHLAQVVEKTGGTDNVTTIVHDGDGNPRAIVGPFGQSTTLAVDGNGFLASISNPSSEQAQFTSTLNGLLESQTDPRGKTSTYMYDATGRLIHDADPAGGAQTLARVVSTNGFTATRTTALARTTTYEVQTLPDRAQRRTVTAPEGTQVQSEKTMDAGTTHTTSSDGTTSDVTLAPDPRFGMQSPIAASFSLRLPSMLQLPITNTATVVLSNPLDPLSLVSSTSTTTVDGRTVSNTYTAANRTLVSTTPAGRAGTYTLDSLGRIVQGQVAGLDPVAVAYDNRGRVASLSIGSGLNTRTLSFTYNAQGLRETITDPIGRTAHVAYDVAGRVTSKTTPDGRVMSLGYDAAGNVTSITPPGRPAHTFAYSARNELTSLTPPTVTGTGPSKYAYDVDKNFTTLIRPGGQTATIDHDTAGRPATLTLATNGVTAATEEYTYDDAGRIASTVSSNGASIAYTYDGALPTGEAWSGPVAGSVTQTYDSSLRVASEVINHTDTIAFTYDDDGLSTGAGSLAITRDPQHGLPTGSILGVVSDSLAYNGFGEVINLTAHASGTPVYGIGFSRDLLGRITQKVETIGEVTDTYTYTYDTPGQLTGVAKNGAAIERYAYDDNGNRTNATVAGVDVTAAYDNQDRLTQYRSTIYTHTAAGDLLSKTTGGQATTYQYDALGDLTGVTLPGGAAITYLIDGSGRRVGKRINGTLIQGFLYGDPLRPVAELDGSGTVVSRFVYADGTVPIYLTKSGVSFRIITDQVGSVRLVVDTATGVIVQRLDYDSFGKVVLDTNPGFQPFGFAGGLYDVATKLLRFGVRDYDAETGRWTAKNPTGFAGNDPNLYRYSLNNPVNLLDPTGLDFVDGVTALGESLQAIQITLGAPPMILVFAVDSLLHTAAAQLGVDPGLSLRETLVRRPDVYHQIDRGSEDFATGRLIGFCLEGTVELAVSVGVGAGLALTLEDEALAALKASNVTARAAAGAQKADFSLGGVREAAANSRNAQAAGSYFSRFAQAIKEPILRLIKTFQSGNANSLGTKQ